MQDNALCTQQEALYRYLDSLLAEIPPPGDAAPTPAASSVAGTVPRTVAIEAVAGHRQLPAWRGRPFKALMFRMAGMEMAAPLVLLAGIASAGPVHHVAGLPSWSGGILLHQGRQVCIVDPACLMGSGRQARAEAQAVPRRYLLFGQGRYALPCEGVREVAEVSPEGVRWRRGSGSRVRPWYCGILTHSMCVLLDLDALTRMLADDSSLA